MANTHVAQRLAGIRTILRGVHQSSIQLSSASKGQERAAFIDEFLSKVMPSVYRFGTGDATDAAGAKSGQLDVVIEYPFGPSLPIVGAGQTRLYLAESVAACIEVKSNLAGQWPEAISTADALGALRRSFAQTLTFGAPPAPQIPMFTVGFTGWSTMETLGQHLNATPNIHGALIIDPGLYMSKRGTVASGDWALWGLINDLNAVTASLLSAPINPALYAT